MDHRPLAYVLEGEFPSYFTGKPMPEKPSNSKAEPSSTDSNPQVKKNESLAQENLADTNQAQTEAAETPKIDLSKIEGQGGFLGKSTPARVFIMAASDMLKDNVIDPEGKSTNALFLMNVIDFLNHRDDVAAMRTKQQRFNPLDETSAALKTAIKMFNIAGLPVLVVLFGLFIWLRRHGRKKRIQMMFPG
jgi:ABC-type uncharacterized transport system involved in gliding motility auxiliary subunit